MTCPETGRGQRKQCSALSVLISRSANFHATAIPHSASALQGDLWHRGDTAGCLRGAKAGSKVSLLPGLSTLPHLHVPAVPTIAGGNNTSEQTRTQKCLDLGHCPLSTPSGPALAFTGQHSLETGRAGALKIGFVSLRWHAHGRK